MSEYKRLREFVEGEDAKADDVETEFDNIASVLDGGITSFNLSPGYTPAAGEWLTGAEVGVPASGEFLILGEETFEPNGNVTALFWYSAEVYFAPATSVAYTNVEARLFVDGVLKDGNMVTFTGAAGDFFRASATGFVVLSLTAGAHLLRLNGLSVTSGASTTKVTRARLAAMTIPG